MPGPLPCFLVEATAWEEMPCYKPSSVRFRNRSPLDIKVLDNPFSGSVSAPRRWHRVVAQRNGERRELILDGEADSAMPLEPDWPTLSCHPVVGRRTPDAQDPNVRARGAGDGAGGP